MQMLIGNRSSVSQPWMSYGGIQTGPITVIQQARQHITNAARSMLGPGLGDLAGMLASDYIAGRDFTRTGLLQNRLSGLLAPGAGTYANAFQQMRQQQTMAMLTPNREAIGRGLKQDFYRNYYALTMPAGSDIQAQVRSAMNNPLSIPSALQFLFDPAQNERALQGIKNTQAGYLYWQQRRNAFGLGGPNAGKSAAQQIGKSLEGMAKNANAWILGKGTGTGYGGFGGASVMQLASIMQNASDLLGDPTQLEASLKQFQGKVQAIAKALAPLKDIFGQDIKAMVDMIQSTTGQNINQLTPAMIRSISTNTVDMARYSGATVAQIASANQKLFAQTAGYGGTTFSRVGGGLTGAYYSGLIAQGNAPAGVHAAQYAGNTARAVASAQASAGVDWTAMAYGLWQQRNQGKTIQDFMTEVRANRASGGTMIDAVMATAGVRTQQGLLRGLNTAGYREALQSGQLTRLGVTQQYQMKLADSIGYLKMLDTGIAGKEFDKLGMIMADPSNAAAVKELVTRGTPEAVSAFVSKFSKYGISQGAVNLMLNRGDIIQAATRYATTEEINQYKAAQEQTRKAFGQLDEMGTGGFISLWRGLSQGGYKIDKKTGKIKINGKLISQKAVEAQARVLFGTSSIKQAQARIGSLAEVFGQDKYMDVIGLAQGEFSKDQEYVSRLRKVAQGAGTDADVAYINAKRAGYISDNISEKSFTDKKAKQIYNEALTAYNKGTGKEEDRKKQLQSGIQRAFRLQNAKNLGLQQLGFTGVGGEQKRKALISLIETSENGISDADKLAKLNQAEYEKRQKTDSRIKDISYAEFQQGYKATAANYNREVDFQRQMLTVMTKLLEWLQGHPIDKEKK